MRARARTVLVGAVLACIALVSVCALGCGAARSEPAASGARSDTRTGGPVGLIAGLSLDGDPEPDDADADGVRSADDLCPTLAEDCDGFHDDDGCPDRDDDGDFVPDVCDLCPRAPETWNASHDEDGCTDAVDGGERDRPHFDQLGDVPALDQIALHAQIPAWTRALLAQPQITRADVIGEAAPDEPDAAALALRRAEAVVVALVGSGVPRERLRAVGMAPHGERTEERGNVRATIAASRPTISLAASRIGTHEVGERHEALDGALDRGWAPEAMTCADGRRVAAQPRDGSVSERGEACVARSLGRVDVRSYAPGLLLTAPVPAATDACDALLAAAYEDLRDGASCRVAYGVVRAEHGSRRSASVLAIDVPEAMLPTWLAVETEAGFTTFFRLAELAGSSASDPHFTVDALTFGTGDTELLVEWRTIDDAGESVGADDLEVREERAFTTLCRWTLGAVVADAVECRTAQRSYVEDEVRRRGDRVVRRSHAEGRVEVHIGEGGAVEIRAVPGAPPGRLRATLGSYVWPTLPNMVRAP